MPKTYMRGFTLIEIMIVVAIVGILAAAVTVNFSESSEMSRDTQRQADLRKIQAALEAYKNRVGRYPAQCTATGAGADGWSGQLGTIYRCDDGTGQYIVGLAPEYIPVLPTDPKLNGTNSGYVYRTNADGSVYKLMAMRTVEAETVTWAHEFSSCAINPDNPNNTNIQISGWCRLVTGVSPLPNNTFPSYCQETDARFQTSYGVWGGFAPYHPIGTQSIDSLATTTKRSAVRNTTTVICR